MQSGTVSTQSFKRAVGRHSEMIESDRLADRAKHWKTTCHMQTTAGIDTRPMECNGILDYVVTERDKVYEQYSNDRVRIPIVVTASP
eukprot:Ihof_evm1s950 gene=Ihof_evmTU1s950